MSRIMVSKIGRYLVLAGYHS